MKSPSIKFKILVILVNLTADTVYSHSYDQMNQIKVKAFSSAMNTIIKEFYMKNGIMFDIVVSDDSARKFCSEVIQDFTRVIF